MNRKQYEVTSLPGEIVIGRQTETGVLAVRIDCTAWLTYWPNLALSIWVVPPGGASAYIASTHVEGKVLVWDVNNADTATAGMGSMEIVGTAAGQRKLSAVTKTFVQKTTTTNLTNPPERGQTALEQLKESTTKAENATAEAKAATDQAKSATDRANAAAAVVDENLATVEADIKAKGAAQIKAIEEKGEFTKNSIPPDYTQLAEDVSSLKDTKAPVIEVEASGSIVTVDDAAAMTVRGLVSHIVPVQDEGTPTPENPLPISGRTVVNALRTGQNLFRIADQEFTRYKAITLPFPLPPGTYTVGALVASDDTDEEQSIMVLLNKSGTSVNSNVTLDRNEYNAKTITTNQTVYSIRLYAAINSENSLGDGCTWSQIMFSAGDAGALYEPYQGQTLTASLPETIYGGSLDWLTGNVENDMVLYTFDGSEKEWGAGVVPDYPERKYFYYDIGPRYTYLNSGYVCSHYNSAEISSSNKWVGCCVANSSQGYDRIIIRPNLEEISTLEKWKEFLQKQARSTADGGAGKPLQVLAKLTKPRSVQIQPQQFDMLKGVNNVRSDSGDTYIAYGVDTKSYIDKKFDALAAALIGG